MTTDDIPYDASRAIATFRSVEMDFSGSKRAWRYGGGRDLSDPASLAAGSSGAIGQFVVEGSGLITAEAFKVDIVSVREDSDDDVTRDESPG